MAEKRCKRLANHAHSVALFAMCCNSVLIHKGPPDHASHGRQVTERLWDIGDIVRVLEAWETAKVLD